VTFTPTDTTNYTTATKSVQISVTQAAPVITWNNPAAINYGTALSATQLNASATVGGSFTYTPAAGSIPAAGTDTLSVTFTPGICKALHLFFNFRQNADCNAFSEWREETRST